MTKKEARDYVKTCKANMTRQQITEKSKMIMDRICCLQEFVDAEEVLAYVNYNQEVETLPLIEQCLQQGKKVLVPKVYGDFMKFHEIMSVSELKPGKYGILEPDNERVCMPDRGFMVMPGLAFDRQLNRAGYGGGYYDKYLFDRPYIFKAAVAFSFQIVESIQTEEYDLRPDIVITEKEIIGK